MLIAIEPSREFLTEQKFLFDGNEVRLLEKTSKQRDYGSLTGFGGTADWIRVTPNRIFVADYKTGIEKNPECAQMKVLAGFAFEIWKRSVSTIIVNIPVSTFPAKSRAKWSAHKVQHTCIARHYNYIESEGCAQYMRDIYCRVSQQRDNQSKGFPLLLVKDASNQCKYCQSKKFCEEWNKNE